MNKSDCKMTTSTIVTKDGFSVFDDYHNGKYVLIERDIIKYKLIRLILLDEDYNKIAEYYED